MDGTTEDLYFEWLYSLIGAVRNRNPARSYWHVSRELHSMEFTWFVANDDNRATAGLELRQEFMAARGVDPDPNFLDLGCSFLEMLIAISRDAGFQSGNSAVEWFHELLGNIESDVTDLQWGDTQTRKTRYNVERVLDRTYSSSGEGGLFPLKKPAEDLRRVELWYQLSAYLMENYF